MSPRAGWQCRATDLAQFDLSKKQNPQATSSVGLPARDMSRAYALRIMPTGIKFRMTTERSDTTKCRQEMLDVTSLVTESRVVLGQTVLLCISCTRGGVAVCATERVRSVPDWYRNFGRIEISLPVNVRY